jgi:soluble lytic murein transglycosylase-like protein
MKPVLMFAQVLSVISICWAQSPKPQSRAEAEYYVASYAHRYKVPVALVRAIVEHESNWQPCVASPKGAVGLMQLMPATARWLGVRDRCNLEQNISGGVRYLSGLMRLFHDDLRLVVAAYYAGEDVVGRRTLAYRNPDVVAYVARIRTAYLRETRITSRTKNTSSERDVR